MIHLAAESHVDRSITSAADFISTNIVARGLADAFIVGRDFIGKDNVALILGDNIFYGHGLSDLLINAVRHDHGARVFAYRVASPERYGVVEIDKSGQALSMRETENQGRNSP